MNVAEMFYVNKQVFKDMSKTCIKTRKDLLCLFGSLLQMSSANKNGQ